MTENVPYVHRPCVNQIGIMLGRLSPPHAGRIQAFPVDTWREEFFRAVDAGLDCLEWVYEAGSADDNPLRTEDGIQALNGLMQRSGTRIASICADIYMAERLVSSRGLVNEERVAHLLWLISRAAAVGARYVVLPFVDESSLRSCPEIEGLVEVLRRVVPAANQTGVELHLESDLEPATLMRIMEQFPHSTVRANYDIGNSAALGRLPGREVSLLASRLGSVHVKDRVRNGGTVALGSGAADFPTCFRLVLEAQFQGPFILQAARAPGLSEIELARRNRQFVERHLGEAMVQGRSTGGPAAR